MVIKKDKKVLVVYTLEPWDHALTHLRFRSPAQLLGWEVIQGREGSNVQDEFVREADFVIIQRVFPHWRDSYQKVIEKARSYQKPIIYEIDDLLIALPPDHPCVDWYRPALEDILIGIMDADRVVVSSELLRQIFSIFNHDIKVWPAFLPDSLWKFAEGQKKRANGNRVRIGYMGGMTHIPDLDFIYPVLNKITDDWGDEVEFHFWGCKPSQSLNGHVYIHYLDEKIDYREFIGEFSKAQADIWLAPLQDTIFNRCKSSIKYWEYAAVGGAGVFSDLEPYRSVVRNGDNGFLVSDQRDWYKALTKLIADTALRTSISIAAHETLSTYGWMRLHLSEWEVIYTTTNHKYHHVTNAQDPEIKALRRFAEQLRERSRQKDEYISALREDIHRIQGYLQQLEVRSQHLDAILNSRSWRLIQLIGKIRGFFSAKRQ
ncbi:MAG: hypothetical protein DDG59_03205 [Anaerolineae bacterium]|jgi:hypothetical protein|nr:MAG: hypothetical protein DDG59_03205 [Anaerolineae bacterium]